MTVGKSFSTRLSLNILAVTSVVFILTIGAAAISSHILISDEATKSLEHLLDATVKDIEKTLQNVEFAVEASSWLVAENKDQEEYLYHITNKIVSENDNIVGSAIAFKPGYRGHHWFSPYSYIDKESGKVLSKQLGNESYDYFGMEWYSVPATTREVHWSEPYYDEGGGEYLMCTYSFPIIDQKGEVYAVMTADITLEFIEDVLETVKPYEHSVVAMMSPKGQYLQASSNTGKYGTSIFSTLDVTQDDGRNLADVVDAVMSGKKGHKQYAVDGHLCFVVYGPVGNGWITSIATDYKDVLERSSIMRNLLSIIGFIGLLILFLISFFAIRQLTRPLQKFSEAAKGIAKGDFSVELPDIDTEDEVRQLRDSFEQMQFSLGEYIEDLKVTTAANERFESELNIASKIQMAMLPKEFPDQDGLDFHAALKPAKEVGGDLYDFVIRDEVLYFVVGDVSGKGVPAAMIMSSVRSSFRLVAGIGLEPGEIVSSMNNLACAGNDSQMFITLFLGKLDLSTGKLTYCNAGHNPIIVGDRYLTVKPNLAIGLFEDFPYEQQSIQLSNGEVVVLYTDGITEAERADKQQFGEQALLKSITEIKDRSSEDICNHVLHELHAFTAGNDQNDDITIMTIKLNR